MKRIVLVTALTLAAAFSAMGQDVEKILKTLDELGNFNNTDFSAVFTIVSQKPGEKDSTVQVRMFRRDKAEQFTYVMLLPEANKGQGYLKDGDNMWAYDPVSRKFSFSSQKENISGSEAKNSDLDARTLSQLYNVTKTTSGKLGKVDVWIIDLKAKNKDASYERLVLYVKKDQTMLLKEEAYGVEVNGVPGRLMRSTYFPNYVELGGKLMFSKMLIVDELNPGEKSQMTMAEQSIAPIPDTVFTKAFLEQVNK